jgi:serine/tyrosine/threonine adenylyltransferase
MTAYTLETLPLDSRFGALPAKFYTRLAPEGLPSPRLVHASPSAAALLGLGEQALSDPNWAEYFAGNKLLPGSDPLAAVYSGHQFGIWAGQLGDGRAHLLGGVTVAEQHWELQLKGAGDTPYSRRADGRAVLRSSIREYLCSEAMAALGIPTTRALSLVTSSLPVRRETWEKAAVVCRMAPSFIRFGTFQHWAARNDVAAIKVLADHVIDHFRPETRDLPGNPYEHLLRDVTQRTAELMAHWMVVGFMHGVMNTDNMSILGLTLDYGPFGFMEAFNPDHICNHSDPQGRYSYANQPQIGQWNCYALASALSPLMASEEEAMAVVQTTYPQAYAHCFEHLMRQKLGLERECPDDEALVAKLFQHLAANQLDYTLFFRRLCHVGRQPSAADERLADLYIDRANCAQWLARWRDRLGLEMLADEARKTAMLAANPKFILRNWIAEQAIRKAESGDFSEVERVYDCLSNPFAEQPENEALAALPPDWASDLEVSCSS